MTSRLPASVVDCSSQSSELVLCAYINHTSQLQIAEVTDFSRTYLIRIVFPQERLLFATPVQAQLKVYVNAASSAVLADIICCDRLIVS